MFDEDGNSVVWTSVLVCSSSRLHGRHYIFVSKRTLAAGSLGCVFPVLVCACLPPPVESHSGITTRPHRSGTRAGQLIRRPHVRVLADPPLPIKFMALWRRDQGIGVPWYRA